MTYVDELGEVSGLEVVQYRGVVQVSQVAHVLATLEFGRIHLLHLF